MLNEIFTLSLCKIRTRARSYYNFYFIERCYLINNTSQYWKRAKHRQYYYFLKNLSAIWNAKINLKGWRDGSKVQRLDSVPEDLGLFPRVYLRDRSPL